VACGYFESGVRVFDIRDPLAPQEVAYFNPPAQVGKAEQLAGSEHASGIIAEEDLSADWCSSPPRFVAPDQLWVTCQDNGFMVLRFTNGAYPLAAAPPVTAPSTGNPETAPVSAPATASSPGASLPATGTVPVAALVGLGLLSAAAVASRRARRS
jgi:LPXTG-motif cell wall-anchored protein